MPSESLETLLVEDDRYQLEALCDSLRLDGIIVHPAATARDALAIMGDEGESISLAILDIDLPGELDGIGLLERLRERWPSVDVIILSGKATARNAAAALNLGASSFLFKPCPPAQLVGTLRSLKERQVLQRRNAAMLRELAELKNTVAMSGLDLLPVPVPNGRRTQSLAHEVSNQLTILLGNFDLLLDETDGTIPPSEELLPHLERMRNVTIRMQKILDDHRTLAGRTLSSSCETCDLRDVVCGLLDQCSHLMDTQGISKRCALGDDPILVRCHRSQIEQLLTNLFLNAIEAMPRGGVIALTLEAKRDEERDEAVLVVRDTGPGIPERILQRLFERRVTNKSTGNGLGLFLAREIARNHGGDLDAGNGPVGARFVLRLPLVPDETKA